MLKVPQTERTMIVLFRRLCLLVLVYVPLLSAGWSPEEQIYPDNLPFQASYPFMATSADGSSVAVWYDVQGTGALLGATLQSRAVNNIGQPLWVLTNPIATNVRDPSSSRAQAVGMDQAGNALVSWTDSTYIFVSRLASGQLAWSSPEIINTPIVNHVVQPPVVAMSPNGNTIVLWTSSANPNDFTVLANVYDAHNGIWNGQINILPGGVSFDFTVIPVAINDLGVAVAMVVGNTGFQGITYNLLTNVWTPVTPIPTSNGVQPAIGLDAAGTAILVWLEDDNTAHAGNLPLNSLSFIDLVTLSTDVTFFASFPSLSVTPNGNAIAVWAAPTGLGSAKYEGTSWTSLPRIELGDLPEEVTVYMNATGDAVAGWELSDVSGCYIQTAVLEVTDNEWQAPASLSVDTDQSANPQVVMTVDSQALAIWENDIGSPPQAGTISSSIFLSPFSPLPASNLQGGVIIDRFLTATDRIHHLTWDASTDPTTVAYRIYRNGALIATLPSSGPIYVYNDHNRRESVPDLYAVVAVNVAGSESLPITILLQ